MSTILIAGMGIVGQHVQRFFNDNADVYDPYLGFDLQNKSYDFAFICVPTENIDNVCDLSNIRHCLSVINADFFVIKSTIPPGSTDDLIKETGKRIVFSPEYFGNTKNNIGLNEHFVILGGDQLLTNKVAQLYMKYTSSSFKIETTDAVTAELVKYMENSFIATKVTFINEFYRISQLYDLDFNKVRSLFLLDERFSPYFTYAFEDQPYYDSHCLNKDLPALVTKVIEDHDYHPDFLKDVINLNTKWKKEFKGYVKDELGKR